MLHVAELTTTNLHTKRGTVQFHR